MYIQKRIGDKRRGKEGCLIIYVTSNEEKVL